MMNQEKIGKFIASLRKEKKMTQEQFAEKLGVSNRSVSRWENGKSMPDLSMLPIISEELGISVSELLNGECSKQSVSIKDNIGMVSELSDEEKKRKIRTKGAADAVLFAYDKITRRSGEQVVLIYTVKSGDTVNSIAASYGVSQESVIYDNQLVPPYDLAVGQALLLTAEVGTGATGEILIPANAEKRSVYVGGYAYPFISRFVLEQTLPYLSDLFIFSYGFTTDGMLIPPILDDTWMITLAKQYGVAPILTLTPFGPDGQFNNRLISAVVNDLTARETLKNEIVDQIQQRGFEGLDIDFEFILASDRDAFVAFVWYMREAVNALGYPVSVALAPKTSADQKGLLYEGKDYPALGEAADYVLLMTYEWGYKYAHARYT